MTADSKQGIYPGISGPADSSSERATTVKGNDMEVGSQSLAKEAAMLCKSHPDFERVVQRVKEELNTNLRPFLEKSKDIVLTLGRAINDYGQGAIQEQDTCMAIKFFLRDEIREGLLSGRNVERYCPEEWKRKTKPRREGQGEENDNLSFSTATGRSPEETTGQPKTQIQDETTQANNEKEYAMVVNALAEAKAQLLSKTEDIEKREADIQLLKQERDELKGLLAKCSFKPAAQYGEEPKIRNKRPREQADLLRPFVIRTTLEVRGSIIPLLVEVMPASKRADVSRDEEKAEELGLL